MDLGVAHARHSVALDLASRTGDRREEANAHNGLARVCRHTGDVDQAREHWQAALTFYAEYGLPEAAEIEDQIRQL